MDGAFLYAAVKLTPEDRPYSLTDQEPFNPSSFGPLPQGLVRSGILNENPEHNWIWFGISLEQVYGQVPAHILPIFLYDLPEDRVSDLLWGRLILIVIVNLGRLVEKLLERGLVARLPRDEMEFKTLFLPVSRKFTTVDSREYTSELRNMGWFAARIVYEFLSLDSFADGVEAMASAVEARVGDLEK